MTEANKSFQHCEFNAIGNMRRIREVSLSFNENMGCHCSICEIKALIWLMIRLRWTSIINKRRRSSRLKASDAAKATT